MSRDCKITCTIIVGIALFAFLPNTMFNWAFNYLQFIPWWGVAICLAISISVAFLPVRFHNGRMVRIAAIAAAVAFPICLFVFRTRIHCFGG